MTVARDIMTPDPQCVTEDQTLVEAAKLLRDLDVGACRSAATTTA